MSTSLYIVFLKLPEVLFEKFYMHLCRKHVRNQTEWAIYVN